LVVGGFNVEERKNEVLGIRKVAKNKKLADNIY
jgi:hypothetical protein